MLNAQLNVFDTVVLAILGLSTLIAFFRGFVKEILSLGAWAGAAAITVYSLPYVTELVKPHFAHETMASGVAALGTYITALVCISLLNSVIFKFLKEGSDVGMLDNLLGLGFGALRGAFIISLGFLLFSLIINKDQYPEWVEQAQTKEYVEKGAQLLSKIAPSYLNKPPQTEEEKEADAKLTPEERKQKQIHTLLNATGMSLDKENTHAEPAR